MNLLRSLRVRADDFDLAMNLRLIVVSNKGFEFPERVDCDKELHILELSIVSPPCILDFVDVGLEKRAPNFDLDRIEAQQSKQFGSDWPDMKRLLEALMQIGIYCDDVHNKNIRLR